MSRACNPAGTGCNRVQQAWQPHAPEPLGRNRAWQVKKPCDDRFCVDPANPTTRWGDGERDADDPHASAAAGSRAARAARAARGALGLGLLACSLLLGAAGPARLCLRAGRCSRSRWYDTWGLPRAGPFLTVEYSQ